MTSKLFFISLFVVAASLAILNWGLFQCFPDLLPYQDLGTFSWFFLVVFSIVAFLGGTFFAKDKEPSMFVAFYMLGTGMKMLIAVILILLYKQTYHPTNNLFILPFFWLYFPFTAYETWVLYKVGK